MTLVSLLDVLRSIGVPTYGVKPFREKKDRILVSCPLAPWFHSKGSDSKPSMALTFSAIGCTKYRCYACHEAGSLWQLVHHLGSLTRNPELIAKSLAIQESDTPTIATLLGVAYTDLDAWFDPEDTSNAVVLSPNALNRFPEVSDYPEATAYIVSRGISLDVARFFDLRFDPRLRRVVFPVRTKGGDLVGAVGRAVASDVQPKYWNYFGFSASMTLGGVNLIPNGVSRVLLVEGFFDVLNCYSWAESFGCGIVCSWKAELSRFQGDILLGLDKVICVCYDYDAAGIRGWSNASRMLSPYGSVRRAVFSPDVDPGSMSKEQFSAMVGSLSTPLISVADRPWSFS
jgi:hypothetical protein